MNEKTIYSKFSNDRAKEFAIYTDILQKEDGSLYVKKYAAREEAKAHIEHIAQAGKLLKEQYENGLLKVNPCFPQEEGIAFSFAEGETLENKIDALLFSGKEEEAKELFLSFAELLQSLAEKDVVKFEMTEEFCKVFGDLDSAFFKQSLNQKENLARYSMKVSNIDLIPSNILVSDHWEMIDYEWTFTFPIPVQFILYRMIYLYLNSSTKRVRAESWNLYEQYGIDEEKKTVYAKMERYFQSYIQGKRNRLDDIQIRLDPGRIDIAGMLKQAKSAINPYAMQVFYSMTGEFQEEDSIWIFGVKQGKNSFEISLPADTEAFYLRIDPMSKACILTNFHVLQKSGYKGHKKAEKDKETDGQQVNLQPDSLELKELSIKNHNGIRLKDGKIGFLTEDPQFYTAKADCAANSYQVTFELLETDRNRIQEICGREEGIFSKLKKIKGRKES
jgi:hypothetical protein